ncbi:MAG: twin-arginine translocation signal domain-containing protein, partial [Candidatus Binatia bacterium]
MATNWISRRDFLKSVGAVTVATALAGRVSMPRIAQAAPASAGKLRFGVQTPPQH